MGKWLLYASLRKGPQALPPAGQSSVTSGIRRVSTTRLISPFQRHVLLLLRFQVRCTVPDTPGRLLGRRTGGKEGRGLGHGAGSRPLPRGAPLHAGSCAVLPGRPTWPSPSACTVPQRQPPLGSKMAVRSALPVRRGGCRETAAWGTAGLRPEGAVRAAWHAPPSPPAHGGLPQAGWETSYSLSPGRCVPLKPISQGKSETQRACTSQGGKPVPKHQPKQA